MKTAKRILMFAALGLFALATPVFASSYQGSCNAMEGSHASNLQQMPFLTWNGGGSNALSANAGSPGLFASAGSQAASSYAPWDGGGSNATSANAGTQGSLSPTPATKTASIPWNGGGSNAMSNAVESLPAC